MVDDTIKNVIIDGDMCAHYFKFESWCDNGDGFIVSDRNGKYRVTITKEEE